MKLLHYGMQRSGTNYLEALLKKRYGIRFANKNKIRSAPMQKHFRAYPEKHIVPAAEYANDYITPDYHNFEKLLSIRPDGILVMSKDPYSWYLSYCNWAKRCNWPPVSHHYIEEYNLFYGMWRKFGEQTDKIVFVRYLDLLRDTEAELDRIEAAFKLKKNLLGRFASTKVKRVKHTGDFPEERRRYYLEEKYLDDIDPSTLQAINEHLDKDVLSFLGYEKRGER